MLDSIHRTFSYSTKVLNDDNTGIPDKGTCKNSDNSLAKAFLDSTETVQKRSCSICGPTSAMLNTSCDQPAEESSCNGLKENSLAIVLAQTTEAALSANIQSVSGLPELKPGWPLLHRKILSDRQSPGRSLVRHISVVQWAMQLPSRKLAFAEDHVHKQTGPDPGQYQSLALDSESGAIVPVNADIGTASSPDHNSRRIPKELEGLHEKYSSTCRLFKYQELLSATSNFLPGMFHRSIVVF